MMSLEFVQKSIQQIDSQITRKRINVVKTALGMSAHIAFFAAFFAERYTSMTQFTRACNSVYSLMAFNPLLQGLLLYKREIPKLKSAPETWRGLAVSSEREKKTEKVVTYLKVPERKLSVVVSAGLAAYEFYALAGCILTYAPLIKRLSASAQLLEVFQQQLRLCTYVMTVAGTIDMANQYKKLRKAPEKDKLIMQGHYITKGLLKFGFFAEHVIWLDPANELLHHCIHSFEIMNKKR